MTKEGVPTTLVVWCDGREEGGTTRTDTFTRRVESTRGTPRPVKRGGSNHPGTRPVEQGRRDGNKCRTTSL